MPQHDYLNPSIWLAFRYKLHRTQCFAKRYGLLHNKLIGVFSGRHFNHNIGNIDQNLRRTVILLVSGNVKLIRMFVNRHSLYFLPNISAHVSLYENVIWDRLYHYQIPEDLTKASYRHKEPLSVPMRACSILCASLIRFILKRALQIERSRTNSMLWIECRTTTKTT